MSWQKVWRKGSNELLSVASQAGAQPWVRRRQARQGKLEERDISAPVAGSRRLGRVGAVKYNQSFLDAGYDFEQ
jgi:hypothetical protein